jgi:hypothetical protein
MRRWTNEIRTLLWRGLPSLAVYALVLQAFLAGAAPAAAFDPDHPVLCSEMANGSGAPAPAHSGHDGTCLCAAACATPHAPLALGAAHPATLLTRVALTERLAHRGDEPLHPQRRHAGPGARGPPRG